MNWRLIYRDGKDLVNLAKAATPRKSRCEVRRLTDGVSS